MKNKKGFSKMAYTASQKGYENLIFNYKQMQKSDDELTSLLGTTLINYTNIMRNNDIPSSTQGYLLIHKSMTQIGQLQITLMNILS